MSSRPRIGDPLDYRPTPEEVDSLIEAARRHPLGIEFLRDGELGSVAMTFQTHAFTVDAARIALAGVTQQHRRVDSGEAR